MKKQASHTITRDQIGKMLMELEDLEGILPTQHEICDRLRKLRKSLVKWTGIEYEF